MKKLLSLLLCALLLCACLPAAMAEDELTDASGSFTYVLRGDGSAELLEYKGPDGRVIIPKALEGHPLTAVRKNPFYYYDTEASLFKQKNCTVAVTQDHPYLATINGVLFGKRTGS